ncbi:hypothetical protein ACFUJR_09930 [Streptomyces sp. NPDC057271]
MSSPKKNTGPFPERGAPEMSTVSEIGTTMPFASSSGSATCAWM